MREVIELEDFQNLVREGRGYFLVTDTENSNRIHNVRVGNGFRIDSAFVTGPARPKAFSHVEREPRYSDHRS